MKNRAFLKDIGSKLMLMIVIIYAVSIGIYAFSISFLLRDIDSKVKDSIKKEFDYSGTLTSQAIKNVIADSRSASYERTIEFGVRNFRSRLIGKDALYNLIDSYLRQKYSIDRRYLLTVFFTSDNPDVDYFTDLSAKWMQYYQANIKKRVQQIAQTLSTRTYMLIADNNIYCIRNIYSISTFEHIGTLVLQVDPQFMFPPLPNTDSMDSFAAQISPGSGQYVAGENAAAISGFVQNPRWNEFAEQDQSLILSGTVSTSDFRLNFAQSLHKEIALREVAATRRLMQWILPSLLPLILFVVMFLRKHVKKPIGQLMRAIEKINTGELGVKVEGYQHSNYEFDELVSSFNGMSDQIVHAFDHAYTQELAQRDAKILALQSQINPHFLNNTLEIINWQARMEGATQVPPMIEALSHIVDGSMNRDNRRLIPLSEELQTVDAYLFIVSTRLGKRLQIRKSIDDSMLNTMVPGLVLQTLVENAITHGIEFAQKGELSLSVYPQDDQVIIKLTNNGKPLSPADVERINELLNSSITQTKRSGRLGIRNVNERIKLIFGRNYGLQIFGEGGLTVAIVNLPRKSISQ